MTVNFLVKMLTSETEVIIKDATTKKIYRKAKAEELVKENIGDKVKDWNFSRKHIIYI